MQNDIHQTIHLVRQAKSGDAESYNKLFERYLPQVLQMVRLALGPKLRQKLQSMDIVQDVMCRAIKAFEQFDVRHEKAFRYWIRKLVQNEIKSQIEHHSATKRNLDNESPIHENPALENLAAQSIWQPSKQLAIKEDMTVLQSALDQLEPDEREIIIMRKYEELSFMEIAEILGCTENTARMRFVRSQMKLIDLCPPSPNPPSYSY